MMPESLSASQASREVGFTKFQTPLDRIIKRQVDTWRSAIDIDANCRHKLREANERKEKSQGAHAQTRLQAKQHEKELEAKVQENKNKLKDLNKQKLAQQAFRQWERQEAAQENADVLAFFNNASREYDQHRRLQVAQRQRQLREEGLRVRQQEEARQRAQPAPPLPRLRGVPF